MSALAARARALLALDGPLATTVLAVFGYFTVSVSYLACLVPLFAFTSLVGWQATHLAVWLGAASLLPLVPATYALLLAARVLLAERGDAHGGRVFWTAFVTGCRRLWWAAASLSLVAVLLQYDLALFGGSDAVVLLVAAGAAVVVTLLIGVCVVAGGPSTSSGTGAVVTLTAAATAIGRRPHIALSWLLLLGVGLAATAIPLLGPALALFLPALVGAGIHICNDALRLIRTDETSRTS